MILLYLARIARNIKNTCEKFLRDLKEHGLKLHPRKWKFYQNKVAYVGHMIYPRGLGVLIGKVEVIWSMPKPHDVSRLCAFLGLCNYYRKFVKTLNAIAKAPTM